jgi:hypothetical protein
MVVVPKVTPPAIPVPAPIVAMAVLLLLHTPVPVASENVKLLPAQTAAPAGVIATGVRFTVTIFVAAHPVPSV